MKRLWKVLRISLITILSTVTLLFIASLIFREPIIRLFVNEVNSNLVRPATAKKIGFSLIRQFPHASIQIEDLTLLSASSSHDTLAYVKKLNLALKITALLHNEINIGRMSLSNGRIFMYTDSNNISNILFWKSGAGNDSSSIKIDIGNIKISGTSFTWLSETTGVRIDAVINDASSRLIYEKDSVNVGLTANIEADTIRFGSTHIITGPLPAQIRTELKIGADGMFIEHSGLNIGDQELSFSGNLYNRYENYNIALASDRAMIEALKKYFPAGARSATDDYGVGGSLAFSCNFMSDANTGNDMFINSSFTLTSGELVFPENGLNLNNIKLSSNLNLSTGDPQGSFKMNASSASFIMKDHPFHGSFILNDLTAPEIDLLLTGSITAAEALRLSGIEGVSGNNGLIRTNIRMRGKLPEISKITPWSFLGLDRSVNLGFTDVSLSGKYLAYPVSNLCGNIMIAGNGWFDGISFLLGERRVLLNGKISGLSGLSEKGISNLSVTAGVWIDRFDTEMIKVFGDSFNTGTRDAEKQKVDPVVSFNIDFSCDSLVSGKFRSSYCTGSLEYTDNNASFNRFSMNTLGGTIAGEGSINHTDDNNWVASGSFDLSNVDINETFSVFNNFGQDELKAENIRGALSGKVSINMHTDSLFNPDLSSVSASGNYSIINGELVNFEPITKLSGFIELSELRDIRFSELKNDIFIDDQKIIIPSMDIKSSAVDLSVSGEQSFSGNYLYHAKLLLSEILSRKAADSGNRLTEFGVVEDDNLGRTTVYLKLEDKGDGARVSYDMAAMRGDLRQDLKTERENLRNILNEEYGWYSNDTTRKSNPEETRKFRIIWEEADSIGTTRQVEDDKKLPLLRLFKKKKGNQ